MSNLVFSGPSVKISAHSALAFIGVGECQRWRGESFAFFEGIGRIVVVDAGKEMMIVGFIGIDTQAIVSTVA